MTAIYDDKGIQIGESNDKGLSIEELKEYFDPLNSALIRTLFTRGDCHSLAFALNRITGAPLVIFLDNNFPTHVAVKIDKKVLDIDGLKEWEDIVEEWGEPVEITREEFWNNYAEYFSYDPVEDEAIYYANLLVNKYIKGNNNGGSRNG